MSKRANRWAIGALGLVAWATTVDAGAEQRPAGCHGLSPASASGCTAEELRAALDRR